LSQIHDLAISDHEQVVQIASSALKAGQIVVVPTESSYALLADAFHPGAIALLRIAKRQVPTVPLPVVGADIATVESLTTLAGPARDLAHAFWPGQLTVLTRANSTIAWKIGPHDAAVSVRVPSTDITREIVAATGPCVMTGANFVDEMIPNSLSEIVNAFGDQVSQYLDAGVLHGENSTVLDATGSTLRVVRPGAISLTQLREVAPMVIDASATK
jgi:tRNA threonylcarbamoyl adenosine modification protein (Sua5/YciO/YrdC/YwlC family)